MNLRVLEYFLAVAEEQNISRAAETLHVTQPTLSRQLSQLENELGVVLFVRGKKFALTDAGLLLRDRARDVLRLIHRIEAEFDSDADPSGLICVSGGDLLSTTVLLDALARFHDRYPLVRFQFHAGSAESAREELERGLVDFALLLEPVDVSQFDYLRMPNRERWGLLMPRNHPLAHRKCVERQDLYGVPLITAERLSVQSEIESWLGESLSALDIMATYNLMGRMRTLVADEKALALTIEGATDSIENSAVVFRPLFPELSMSCVLAWKKQLPRMGVARRFLEHFHSMLKKHTAP